MGPTKEAEEIPVYMFMGFLESGKTTFANETLIDRGFTEGEPTLLLVCEEGIEEYDEEYFEESEYFRGISGGIQLKYRISARPAG